MFVRCKKRFKDGKEHRYWSVVENVRVSGGRVVQRQVLSLGEINDSQRAAWWRSIEVVEGASRSKQVALFPEDREAPELECEVVQVRLAELTLHAPRQCWWALTLWERLELDRFWGLRLPASREGTLARPAPVGGMLVGADAVGASGAGPVLGTALAGEPRRDPMVGYFEDSGLLPPYRPRQRLASSSAVVRTQCIARSAGM